jgi:capsule biosynthesis phosphatase
MIYVFDIDGTICNNTFGKYDDAQPIKNRIKKINDLYDSGNKIIFFTARGMNTYSGDIKKVNEVYYNFTKEQLNKWEVKFHSLILGKPQADLYIDDKGIKDVDFF